VIQVHHATFTFAYGRGADKEIFCDLNFRRSELYADLITLVLCKDVTTLYDYNLSLLDISF